MAEDRLLTLREKKIAIKLRKASALSKGAIAKRLGVTEEQVRAYLKLWGL